jgi:SAM-dependent methyltransferase/uncharacterized protein YbaR (Trm112 family)
MKDRLLDLLACPECGGELSLADAGREDSEIISGTLNCAACPKKYPIIRGVPRFADVSVLEGEKAVTAEGFGFEWQHFTQSDAGYAEQFLGWIDPVRPEEFENKVVLDAGCGKGRHMKLAAEWGASDVVGVDISDAVETAFDECRGVENMHVVQADLCSLPLKRVFDHAYSVGVIDHILEPIAAFRSVASKVRPGGHLSVWVYGAENNWWIEKLVTPVRIRFTSRLKPRTLLHFSKLPTLAVFLASKGLYRPLNKFPASRKIASRLFYNDYMNTIGRFGWKEQHNIVFDHLVAPTVTYVSRPEFESWWDDIGADEVAIGWHNRNSWRGTGRIK